jgi:hypothetical protein
MSQFFIGKSPVAIGILHNGNKSASVLPALEGRQQVGSEHSDSDHRLKIAFPADDYAAWIPLPEQSMRKRRKKQGA